MASAPVPLRRRGVLHGRFRPAARVLPDGAEVEARWDSDRPIFLPDLLRANVAREGRAIRATLALFERLRRGASFQEEVGARLARQPGFALAGASVDQGDEREIEKVFVDARAASPPSLPSRGKAGGRIAAAQLSAKLSWIAHDPRDTSLRIRFSFGAEALRDWQKETRRAPWADRYARAVFPECRAVEGRRVLVEAIEHLVGRRVRFSERIVYSNAPGGGAIFHHDDEPWQHGVLFSQLAGETAWLALPKRELAAHLARFARARPRALRARLRADTPARALRALSREDDAALEHTLNATPAFTRALVEAGAFHVLRAGDVLLLPNHGPDDTCWHSVFALGARPSLAHSYGIFARRREAEDD